MITESFSHRIAQSAIHIKLSPAACSPSMIVRSQKLDFLGRGFNYNYFIPPTPRHPAEYKLTRPI